MSEKDVEVNDSEMSDSEPDMDVDESGDVSDDFDNSDSEESLAEDIEEASSIYDGDEGSEDDEDPDLTGSEQVAVSQNPNLLNSARDFVQRKRNAHGRPQLSRFELANIVACDVAFRSQGVPVPNTMPLTIVRTFENGFTETMSVTSKEVEEYRDSRVPQGLE